MSTNSARRPSKTVLVIAAAAAGIAAAAIAACGRPTDTVQVESGGAKLGSAGRTLAPRMTVKDHRGQSLAVPVPGRITVLSFASRSTADTGSETCRGVRVAHPEIEILEIMDLSSIPGLLSGTVEGKIAARHNTILAATTQAFAAVNKPPPADLEARIHIVPDWDAAAFKAYGATNTDDEVQVAVIDAHGGLVTFFAKTPPVADVSAAVRQAVAAP